jgi:predicted dehydrogenase
MVGIAIVGYGYWGPNLARNFAAQPNCRLVAICEPEPQRAAVAARTFPGCELTPHLGALLARDDIHAVVIATPLASHFSLARESLLAGKDVLVEKPMTRTAAEAAQLIELAQKNGRILAVDHTFLYSEAVQKIKELVDSAELGELLYIDSVRTNLGLFQQDHNVVFDLAPHELSIMFHLLDRDPVSVQATGACHSGNGIESLAYLHIEFENNLIAHFHFNWLAPLKIRRTLIAGTRKMIVYDDMERSEKIKVYDQGISLREADRDSVYKVLVDYRTGDMVAPKLSHREPLDAEAAHFVECVRSRTPALADGAAGLRVVQLLEASQRSIKNRGKLIEFDSRETIPLLKPTSSRIAA